MNYRHAFHAGNFGDVLKHALLVALVRGMQQKEKGFLYLDTHAGRGAYDLGGQDRARAPEGRAPEWPEGIGRLWSNPPDTADPVADYLRLAKEFDRTSGNIAGDQPRFYPGSPILMRELARPQDRLALCERQPDECAALRHAMGPPGRWSVHAMDGYEALRAMLPPPERRALVLVDPPYEATDEVERLAEGLEAGLRRLPAATFAIWYPLTGRVRPDAFFRKLIDLRPPPTLAVELTVASEASGRKLRGCAVTILNPPWKFESIARRIAGELARALAIDAGAGARATWVVPET